MYQQCYLIRCIESKSLQYFFFFVSRYFNHSYCLKRGYLDFGLNIHVSSFHPVYIALSEFSVKSTVPSGFMNVSALPFWSCLVVLGKPLPVSDAPETLRS